MNNFKQFSIYDTDLKTISLTERKLASIALENTMSKVGKKETKLKNRL